MVVDEKHYHSLANRAYSLSQVGELFGLSSEELDNENCGFWLVDAIKQLQTSQLILKGMQMRKNENQRIENYTPNPFENKNTPLVEPQETTQQ